MIILWVEEKPPPKQPPPEPEPPKQPPPEPEPPKEKLPEIEIPMEWPPIGRTGIAPLKYRLQGFFPSRHDGAIIDLKASATTVTVTVKNEGESPETFVISTSYTRITDPPIGTQTVTLASGATTTLTFPWTPPGGGYRIHAEITTVPDEFDVADNTYTRIKNARAGGDGGSKRALE